MAISRQWPGFSHFITTHEKHDAFKNRRLQIPVPAWATCHIRHGLFISGDAQRPGAFTGLGSLYSFEQINVGAWVAGGFVFLAAGVSRDDRPVCGISARLFPCGALAGRDPDWNESSLIQFDLAKMRLG